MPVFVLSSFTLRRCITYDKRESERSLICLLGERNDIHMSESKRLSELECGQVARIIELKTTGDMRRRLQDMGMIEGTIVECVGKSPLGDPTAYLVRGAVIALRVEDAAGVFVR